MSTFCTLAAVDVMSKRSSITPPSATLGGWQLAVSQHSANKDAAIAFVRYLTSAAEQKRRRSVHNMERKSLRKLGLDETASAEEIRARYKTLVKRHHPDANGGDRSLEDKLREIIQAYNYLKNAGFC